MKLKAAGRRPQREGRCSPTDEKVTQIGLHRMLVKKIVQRWEDKVVERKLRSVFQDAPPCGLSGTWVSRRSSVSWLAREFRDAPGGLSGSVPCFETPFLAGCLAREFRDAPCGLSGSVGPCFETLPVGLSGTRVSRRSLWAV